ncbi:MAG: AI-2E family transporter [Deltaproteobacteria bacterium]|jgi:predicted PurR-regulated permease PerM|nr:AI-2E family transporter [Deltaproteobacteria bacterium]MBT6435195.1 AI-2E family transporter [Deltaproteobacteria bacterium]MBT6491370.1 AI-2E family transporter [Deltaproteobacteria bacterium]
MSQDTTTHPLDRMIRGATTLAMVAAVFYLVAYVADVLVPLALGILLAYLLDPAVAWVQSGVKKRNLAVFITVSGALLLLTLLAWVLVPMISGEFKNLMVMVREALEPGSTFRAGLRERIPVDVFILVEQVLRSEEVQSFVKESNELRSAGIHVMRKLVPGLWGILSGAFSVVGLVIQALLVFVYLIFILVDFRKFQESWRDFLPPQWRVGIVDFLSEFNDAMSVYFRGQFLVASTVGVVFAIGFSIVGIKMAILMGLMIGLLNMVPYLQLVGVVPALILAVVTAVEQGSGVQGYLIGVGVVFLVAQILQDVVITPRIMGEATGLRPVVILFCVFFWGKLLGFLGVLLAIPLTCLGLAHYRRLLKAQAAEMQAKV